MRNLKRALSLALASVMVLGLTVAGSGASYADVTAERNQEAIEVLQAVSIMTGDGNGSFNPDANVTRNEMAVIMSNLMDYRVANYKGTSPFSDVPDWAEPYVAACCTNGITSGVGGGLYGGEQQVTTAQAALMVMKALGYFQNASDFGEDWQLSTVSQGNKITLFKGVDSAIIDPMTRNGIAQLVLNTLESGIVEPDDSSKVNVSFGEAQVAVGGTKYVYVTSSEKYASAINNIRNTYNDGQYSSGSIVELGEKLYAGDLKKDEDVDDFGRTSNNWEYKTKEVGKYAEEADYSWTKKVTSKTLYDALGCEATNYVWTVTIDGDDSAVNADNIATNLYTNRNDNDQCFLQKNDGAAAEYRTGNGVVTEVFVNSNERSEVNPFGKTVRIAVMHRHAAEILRVDEEDGTITLSDLSQSGEARAQDEFDTSGYKEGDIVIYTYVQDKIQEVYAAERMEGEVTRVKVNTDADGFGDNFAADGTTYSYNKTMKASDKLLMENVNNDVVAYLDANGYVAYIDQSAVNYDYAYVLDMGETTSKWDTSPKYGARLVLGDGTQIKVDTDEKSKAKNNTIVSFSKDSKGVYTLAEKNDYTKEQAKLGTKSDLKIETDRASFRGIGQTYTINSKTLFIVATPDDNDLDDYSFSIYQGIANVPDIDGKATTQLAVITGNLKNSNIAKVVYIEDADTSGEDIVFIRTDTEAKLVKDSAIGDYYELNAWIEGARTALKVKEGSSAARDLRQIYPGAGLEVTNKRTIVAAKSVSYNSDELVTIAILINIAFI